MAAIALKRGGSFSSASGSSHGSDNGGFLAVSASPAGSGPGLTLASLDVPATKRHSRRNSLARNESQSTLGDDLSLLGECDISSIRSDNKRPGRRASLSAAIELTRSPPPKRGVPKRTASGSRGGRRNSFFGSNGGKETNLEHPHHHHKAHHHKSTKGSRRASVSGYPAGKMEPTEEPEPTPQFFHSRKKDKDKQRHPPTRSRSSSFEKNDATRSLMGKIKRPKGRRASMSSMGNKSNSKSSIVSSNKGSQRSVLSHSSASSDYDISDEEDTFSTSGGPAVTTSSSAAFRRTMTAPTEGAGRSRNYSLRGGRREQHYNSKKATTADNVDLGYGDPEDYDPQLPPPPQPGANKPRSKFASRRGSTGTAVSSFSSKSAAQRSLKESLQWKQGHHHHLRSSNKSQRRGSTSSSIFSAANSVATDKVTNTEKGGGAARYYGDHMNIPPPNSPGGALYPRVPADVPPGATSRRVPADVPPGGRRVPADVPPGKKVRVPLDVPPSSPASPLTPQPIDKLHVHYDLDRAPLTPLGGDHSESTLGSYDNRNSTPLQSNKSTRLDGSSSQNNISLMGNHSALGLMSDESDGSHGDRNSFLNLTIDQRRRGAGLNNDLSSSASKPATRSSLLGGSSNDGGGFNPYGTNSHEDSEEEEEDDEEEETEQDREENKRMAEFGSEAGDIPSTTMSTTDTTPTTLLLEGESSSTTQNDNQQVVDNDKDDSSVDSMTSEAPQEKAPAVEVDVDEMEMANSKDFTTKEAIMDEIGATGDWSGGVKEDLLARPGKANSLLDRYPGSDYGHEAADLGYGYSHLGQSQQPKVLNAYDDESERKDDFEFDHPYGPSDLYDEDYSSFGWREHRPRAADDMEFINMEQLMSKAKNTKGLYLPTFIPAHGCTNASDFIVRCFVARLRAGVTVTKHSRSRFCKSHDRILHILPTGYHITWIPEVEEEVATDEKKKTKTKKPPTKLDLTKCLEVRHAWSRDPKSMRYTGTSTLRSKCKEGAANRSFALIYPHRTVDFTATTVDQCKILMEGFSALCFRLQMAKLEQQSGEEDTTQRSATISIFEGDNDSTTASLTGTNMSAPWGL